MRRGGCRLLKAPSCRADFAVIGTMQSQTDIATTGLQAVEVLLREHPDALLLTQTADGLVLPPPASLGLAVYPVLASEGRTLMDLCVAGDRMESVNAFISAKQERVAEAKLRLSSNPSQWMIARLLNLLDTHGVVLTVLWRTTEAREDIQLSAVGVPFSSAPRFCTRKQDQEGNVLECDEAYLQMFGYTTEEVIGKATFPLVHPEDQARVIEGWLATVATGRMQMFRIRMKRQDGSWLWVDTTLHNYLHDADPGYVLAECIDVSAEMAAQEAERAAQEALQDREELLRNLIEEMPDGLLQLDSARGVIYHNARLLEILNGADVGGGFRSGSADDVDPQLPEGQKLLTVQALLRTLTDDGGHSFAEAVERALKDGVRQDVEVEAVTPFGRQQNLLMKVRPLRRDSGMVTGVIASVQDVTDSARARRELEKRATFDPLTGAHNRSSIMEALARELDQSNDTGVVYVDLDQFKPVNDSFGHAAGDEVLAHVAERLKDAMRSGDELGRLGGDEFLVLLRGISRVDIAMSTAQRFSESIRGTFELSCGSIELCVSVGVACVDDRAVTAEELVERADVAMYRSKDSRLGIPVLAA
jgi:diguanylate cyclase (GGDEF)-like protein/PAS domain S-box-containing protein